jgi:hypothetical protein
MQITLVFGPIAHCVWSNGPKDFFGWSKFDTIETRLPEGCEHDPCKRSHVNEVEGANRG